MKTTKEQLIALRDRITSGPWEHINRQDRHWSFNFVRSTTAVVENDRGPNYNIQIGSDENYASKNADHEFMVLVRNNLDEIIEALK